MRIVVLGYIVRGPLGGLAWHHLQYMLGLKQLGHDALFLEDSDDYPGCYNPETFTMSADPQPGLRFLQSLFDNFGLQAHWAYFDAHTNCWFGQSKQQVAAFCATADIVLNLSGMNPVRNWWAKIPVRIFVDTDPVFVQLRHLTNPSALSLAKAHNTFVSFGENIGKAGCTVPMDGFNWKPTRQPVFLPAWPVQFATPNGRWTTVMQWDSYAERDYRGQCFGMKSASFAGYFVLPQNLPNETFEIALGSKTAPVSKLEQNGWHIVSSQTATQTPFAYRNYIAGSKGEWTVAKHGYATTNCGWFSERTLNYMASGKPVVVQDTGFSSFLPTGEGLLPFSNIEEAVAQLKKATTDYAKHAKAARRFVEEHFEAGAVLHALLSRL